jgi:hypothetical protein
MAGRAACATRASSIGPAPCNCRERGKDCREQGAPAMNVNLGNIFAGRATGSGKPKAPRHHRSHGPGRPASKTRVEAGRRNFSCRVLHVHNLETAPVNNDCIASDFRLPKRVYAGANPGAISIKINFI